jgi:hypothetical protein
MSKINKAASEETSALEKHSHAPSAAGETDGEDFNPHLGREFEELKIKVDNLAKGVGFDPDADLTGANTEGTSNGKPKASTFGQIEEMLLNFL